MQMDQLLASPPKSFSDFAAITEPRVQTEPPGARYRLACANCGHQSFTVHETVSGEYGAAGLEATCAHCGKTGSIFHASRDGYDGRLGNLLFLEPVTGRVPLRHDEREVGETMVACEISFSIDPDELVSNAAESGLAPQDLFDWFSLYARHPGEDEWRNVWNYECA